MLDPAAIYDVICERTRAIVVVSPNNPTGTWLDEDCAEALCALGLPLISWRRVFSTCRSQSRWISRHA